MREHIGCGNHGRLSVAFDDIPSKILIKESLNCLNAVRVSDLRDIGRFNSQTRIERALNPFSKVPSLEPMSTANSPTGIL